MVMLICLGTSAITWSQVTTFDYTGALQTYTVPDGVDSIRIEVAGAQGGGGLYDVVGGEGAIIIGDFTVTSGEEFTILVGGSGIDGTDDTEQAGGTGGGGSFVVNSDDEPVIIAGGGGGAMGRYDQLEDGGPGQAGEDGQSGEYAGGVGGTGGNGGGTWPWTGWHSGTGGGGFYTDGSADSNGSMTFGTNNGRGKAYVNGGAGGTAGSEGRAGGYGGGGAAGFTGAGGGGYSGGGSGTHDEPAGHSGGGGGSYNTGENQSNTTGGNTGNGYVTITVLCQGLTVTATDETYCFGEEITLEASSETGGTVTWDGGVENGVPFTLETAGLISYTATSDSDDDCAYTAEFTVLELPDVTISVDETEICMGDTVYFGAGGADTYVWDPADVVAGAPYIPEVGLPSFMVTGTDDETGCSNEASVEVTVHDLPEVTANADDTEICLGESVVLNGGGATSYEWSDDVEDGATVTPDATGDYNFFVTGTDENGCVDTASVDITVFEELVISYTTSDELLGGDGSIDITVSGGNPAYAFDWDNDGTGDFDDDEDLTDAAGGTYIVVVEDEAGCSVSETIVVESQLSLDEKASSIVSIYPNPTQGLITIQHVGEFQYALYNVNGELVQAGTKTDQVLLDLSSLSDGIYMVQISSETISKTLKVVKK